MRKMILFILLFCFVNISAMSQQRSKGVVYIISGPSGVGKTTLVTELQKEIDMLNTSISYTTREKRANEKEGVDYYFISKKDFINMINRKMFLVHNMVLGNLYGISREKIHDILSKRGDVVLTVDWQGAREIRRNLNKKIVSIFILPLSSDVLTERLKKRNQDDDSIIEKKIKAAPEEISHSIEYDYIIYNDNFEKAISDLKSIVLMTRAQMN